jgi:Domain of unknown function (DUF4157)
MFDRMIRLAPAHRPAPAPESRPRVAMRRPVASAQGAVLHDGGAGPRAAIDQAAADGGAPVDARVRAHVEEATGADLGDVRVHTGASSQQAAAAVEARAYTLGQHIHFGAGQYRPGSGEGDHLIAHELAHTVQQGPSGGTLQGKLEVGPPGDAAEVEADGVATAALSGARAGVVHRAPAPLLRRAPLGNNASGSWDLVQTTTDRPSSMGFYKSDATITFTPNEKTVHADEIAFVQTVRVVDQKGDDARPKPSNAARATADHTSVDSVTQHGWYGYREGKPASYTPKGRKSPVPITEPGRCPPPKAAIMRDTPEGVALNIVESFEAAAVAKSGADAGKIYGAVTWGFDADGSGHLTAHPPALKGGGVSSSFKDAVKKWNDQAAGKASMKEHPDQEPLPALH